METAQESVPAIKFDPRGGHNRYNCNFDFFKQWTDEMAYVLGFLYADGCIIDAVSSRTQYIEFTNKEKKILEKIKDAMSAEHPIRREPSRITFHRNRNRFYRSSELFKLRIGSRRMFNDLLDFGIIPNKSKIVTFPNIPSRYLSHFVRGYFDGDGCVYIKKGKGKYGQPILKGIAIIFTSGSRLFLEGLRDKACTVVGLGKRSVYYSNYSRTYYLKYDTFESLKWFKVFYNNNLSNLFLERKFAVFKKYFQLRPIRADETTLNILNNYNNTNIGQVSK